MIPLKHYKTTNNKKDEASEKYFLSENAQCELDFDLANLRRRYIEIKKERQQNEKEALSMENKMKLLMLEEQKAIKREEKEMKKSEEFQKTRLSFMTEREKFFEAKLDEGEEYFNKKEQIFKMRQRTKSALKIQSVNLLKKKNEELNKMKHVRKELDQISKLKNKEMANKKQGLAKFIKEEKQLAEDKKKRSEVIKSIFIF